ncbi:DNA mismatch repair endonuclease MutL [candidate division KSB1 bacterium]|nr:DNA mismatch repair endonuclease MutL [candidate division KSB1 bacterium]MBL7095112.1 DNA mismatch repair endonuclease MutL [candidate division KSB1 bacterium]
MIKNRVKILPEDLTNKIAAGEVVDRPASIVKELVENAIDAGSDEIFILLKNGGKTLIQVVDNGTGMSREDAILAIQRHTTSKISNYDDLHNIKTLGFRGEALASIASVSRMELKTITNEKDAGSLIKIEGGTIDDVIDTGGARGTSVAVKNLFYNTPARRKFLKTDETEYRHILSFIQRFTLSCFDVSFTVYHNDQKIYDVKPADPEIRLVDVLGGRYKNNLVTVEDKGTVLQIWGFVGKQDTAKKSRGDQFLFLNGRYIVNRALNHAVISSFGTIIPRGEFPLYALFLEIDPRRIDVNVHPSKMEVKFADERLIYNLLRAAVKRALSSEQVIPSLSPQIGVTPQPISMSKEDFLAQQTAIPLYETAPRTQKFPGLDIPQPQLPEKKQAIQMPPSDEKFERANIWQINNQYILSEIKSGLIIIDQHVAHERILYEKALKDFEISNPASQQLLFPHVTELTPDEYSYLTDILPFLEKIGFVIKGFGGNTVVIEGVPSGMKISSPETILNEIIDEFKQNRSSSLDIRDNVAKSYSCKMAIKKGEPLTLEEMNNLIDQLFATQSPYFCPHGRPVIINLSIEELDKRFGRI